MRRSGEGSSSRGEGELAVEVEGGWGKFFWAEIRFKVRVLRDTFSGTYLLR